MKIRKFLLAIMALSSLSFGFVSCGSDDEDDKDDETQAQASLDGIYPDNITWASVVVKFPWLSNFPEYVDKFGMTNGMGTMVTISDYKNGDLMKPIYEKALVDAGFEKDEFDDYSKTIDEITYTATIAFQEVPGMKMLSVNFSKIDF